MIIWSLEKRKLKDLKEHSKNPRQMSHEQGDQLKKSLETFGLVEKPVINTDNQIIGGHQRLKILKKMGLKEIDCIVPSRQLTEKEVDELCIRLNKNGGQFDYDILANEWELGDLVEWGFQYGDIVGSITSNDEPKEEKKKKMKMCPSCGHEF